VAATVYVLCFLTSLACAILLLRGFAKSRVRLLFWSGLCFLGFALNNALLFADFVVFPGTDLEMIRTLPTLAGLIVLIFGLVWEEQ
jgi:hypothetical protein